jgi:lipid-binding SYLF domain-containing protein
MGAGGRALLTALVTALALFGGTQAKAAGARQINYEVNETLEKFYFMHPGTRELAHRAAGILVFPTVIKAGFGIGGEYGEGAMRIGGHTVGFYNVISGSIGFQFGAQARSVIIMFMTPYALANFQRVEGFRIGVDGSVVVIVVGAGGSIDTDKITSPVIGFITDSRGLMYNLTLEGSKISRIYR